MPGTKLNVVYSESEPLMPSKKEDIAGACQTKSPTANTTKTKATTFSIASGFFFATAFTWEEKECGNIVLDTYRFNFKKCSHLSLFCPHPTILAQHHVKTKPALGVCRSFFVASLYSHKRRYTDFLQFYAV